MNIKKYFNLILFALCFLLYSCSNSSSNTVVKIDSNNISGDVSTDEIVEICKNEILSDAMFMRLGDKQKLQSVYNELEKINIDYVENMPSYDLNNEASKNQSIIYLNVENLSEVLSKNDEEFDLYKNLEENDYLQDLVDNGLDKNKIFSQTDYQFVVNSVVKETDDYFEVGVDFYLPIIIEKQEIDNLKIGDEITIDYPNYAKNNDITPITMTCQQNANGNKSLSFSLSDDYVVDVSLLNYKSKKTDKEYYALSELDDRYVTKKVKSGNIRFSKDAIFATGFSDGEIALTTVAVEKSLYDYQCLYTTNELFVDKIYQFPISINFIQFDNKGYIVKAYNLGP